MGFSDNFFIPLLPCGIFAPISKWGFQILLSATTAIKLKLTTSYHATQLHPKMIQIPSQEHEKHEEKETLEFASIDLQTNDILVQFVIV